MQKPKFSTYTMVVLCIGVAGFSSWIHSGILYRQYSELWDYRRMHPDIIPSTTALQTLAVGHDTTYADALWMQLIQFIAYNIGNGKYLDFTHTILTRIQDLHPHFARAYELDLLFLPFVPSDESEKTQKNKKILEDVLAHYESIMPRLCDMQKIDGIAHMGFGVELWNRTDLQNPCISSLIPYYLASRYDVDLHDKTNAARYYKIASMHTDAPSATRFLGIIASSSNDNHHNGALTFALLAVDGYDRPPYQCQQVATRIVQDLSSKVPWTRDWIHALEQTEHTLVDTHDAKDPLSVSGGSCYDSLERSIKQIYLGYITDLTRDTPGITTEEGLLGAELIDHLPTISSQSGFTMKKKHGDWQYSERP